jgi:hypothetical protein
MLLSRFFQILSPPQLLRPDPPKLDSILRQRHRPLNQHEILEHQRVPLEPFHNRNEVPNRRGFLSALIAAGTAAAIDPDQLLWTPGKKLISIPSPPLVINGLSLRIGDVVSFPDYFEIDARTRKASGTLQQFLVTQAYQSGRTIAVLKPLLRFQATA